MPIGGLGGLSVTVDANIANFVSGCEKMVYIAQKNSEEVVRHLNKIDRQIQNMVTGLAAGFGATMFVGMVKGSIDAVDHLNDLNVSTGIAVTQLSGLALASKQSGSDLDSAAKAVNFLSKNIGANAAEYAALGVTAKDPIEAFKQLSDVFVSIEDPQQRAAVMAKALGKSWQDAASLLGQGGQKIGEVVEQGAKLARVTPEIADQMNRFNDTLDALHVASQGVATQIAVDLVPTLQILASDFLDTKTKSAELANDGFKPLAEALKAVVVLGGNTSFVLKAVGNEMGGIAAQAARIAQLDFSGAGAIHSAMVADAETSRKAFDAWESSVLNANENVAAAVKKSSDEKLKTEAEFTARSLAVQQAYANSSVAIQQAAQRDLAKSFGMTFSGGGLDKSVLDNFIKAGAGAGAAKTNAFDALINSLDTARAKADGGAMGEWNSKIAEAAKKNAAAGVSSNQTDVRASLGQWRDAQSVKMLAEFTASLDKQNESYAFQVELIGKSALEQKQLTNARAIETKLQDDMIAKTKEFGALSVQESVAMVNASRAAAEAMQKLDDQARAAQGVGMVEDYTAALLKQTEAFAAQNATVGLSAFESQQLNISRAAELKLIDELNAKTKAMGALMVEETLAMMKANDDATKKMLETNKAKWDSERAWATGASNAMNTYLDGVTNTAAQTNAIFSKAFKGMEDSLVSFVQTGKLDFKSLADSIVADFIRIQVQQSITKPMAEWMGGAVKASDVTPSAASSDGGGFGSIISAISSFVPKFAAGTDYVPQDMLAVVHQGEKIVPAAQNTGKSGAVNLVVNVSSSTGNLSEIRQAAGAGARQALAMMGGAQRYA